MPEWVSGLGTSPALMLYWIVWAILRPITLIVFRPRITGREHLPRTGPVIVASNHMSVLDPFLLGMSVRRRISFLAKAELFSGKGIKGSLVRGFLYGVGQIPTDRRGGTGSTKSLDAAAQHLTNGGALGIYPEGTRSPDGRLYRARTGVARLAVDTGATVVPVAILGTERILGKGRVIPRPQRFELRFGEPVVLPQVQADDPAAMRIVADAIADRIHALSGQEYVDTYAPRERPKR